MKRLVYGLAEACAVLTILGGIWSLGMAFLMVDQVDVILRAGEYERATLVVQELISKSSRGPGRGATATTTCYAEGTIDGVPEQLRVRGCKVDDGGKVIEAEVRRGERVDVLVNRSMSPDGMLRWFRVLRHVPDLRADRLRLLGRMLPLIYGPMAVPALGALLLGLTGKLLGEGGGAWARWVVIAVLALQVLMIVAMEVLRRVA